MHWSSLAESCRPVAESKSRGRRVALHDEVAQMRHVALVLNSQIRVEVARIAPRRMLESRTRRVVAY